MKHFFTLATAFILAITSQAQSPNKFNYQAVARDLSGNVLVDQDVSVRIAVLEGSNSGNEVFAETHEITTNGFGLFNFQIGAGTPISGDLGLIDWGADSYFLQVSFDGSGGNNYEELSTTELVSVPYAMYANKVLVDSVADDDADPINEIQTIALSGDTLSLSDGGSVYLGTYINPELFDNDSTNEIQVVSFSNDTLYLSGGGNAYLGEYTNPTLLDNDSTNELQVLSLSNDTLYLSNGGFVDLSNYVNQINHDNDSVNEIQTLSFSNDTLYLSEGGEVFMDIPAALWNDSGAHINTSKTVGIGTLTPDTNAALEVHNKPFLPPRLKTEEISELTNNATGMMVFNTDNNCPYYFGTDSWEPACVTGGVSISPGEYSKAILPTETFDGFAQIDHIDLDDDGNYAMYGTMSGTLNIKGSTVTTNSSAGKTLIYLTDDDELGWYKSIPQGTAGLDHFMEMDSAGNVYVAGTYSTTFTIDSTTITSTGATDIFLAKFNAAGVLQFLNSYGGSNNDGLLNMSVGHNNDLYFGGYYTVNTSIGSWYHAASGGSGRDGLFFRTNTSGAVQWSHSTGGNYTYDQVQAISADSSGNVYIMFLGNNSSSVFLNGSFYSTPNCYIAKMNAAATSVVWLKAANSVAGTFMMRVTKNGSNLILAYNRSNNTTLQIGTYSGPLYGSSSTRRGYLVALDGSDGTYDWSDHFQRGVISDFKISNGSIWVSGTIYEEDLFYYSSELLKYLPEKGAFLSELTISGVHEKSVFSSSSNNNIRASTVGLNHVGKAMLGVYGTGVLNVNGQLTQYNVFDYPAIIKEEE